MPIIYRLIHATQLIPHCFRPLNDIRSLNSQISLHSQTKHQSLSRHPSCHCVEIDYYDSRVEVSTTSLDTSGCEWRRRSAD